MTESEKLNLIIIHNPSENTYSLSDHNITPDKAKATVEEFNPHMKPGFTLVTVEQHKAHKTQDAQQCRACRDTVRQQSGLQPIPKFTRRK